MLNTILFCIILMLVGISLMAAVLIWTLLFALRDLFVKKFRIRAGDYVDAKWVPVSKYPNK